MKIALIGASGFIGSAILQEALARQHSVTALVSRPARITPQERLEVQAADVNDGPALARQLQGFDVVISAFSGHAHSDTLGYYLNGIRNIIEATRSAGVPRLLVVGGAGSLFVAPGVQLLDTPGFPDMYRATAEGARQALDLLRAQDGLNWSMLSPAAEIAPGRRTAQFRLGTDELLVDGEGNSRISVEDFALALLDEVEHPAHPRARFTLAY